MGRGLSRAFAGLALLALSGAAGVVHAPAGPASEASWLARAQSAIAAHEYHATRSAEGLQAPNRAHGLRTFFAPDGIRVHDRVASGSPQLLRLSLVGVGRGSRTAGVEPGQVSSEGARVEIRRDGLVEWYLNAPEGLEQGFDLDTRAPGDGELVLELALDGAEASHARSGAIALRSASGRSLSYAELRAEDATGRVLAARFELPGRDRVRLIVDDAGATYPVVVDPLLTQTADTQLESDQAFASFGETVASAGDVNGDGYADVIVGSRRYDAGQTDEGAAFVFVGSAGGIASGGLATVSALLQSNQIGASFGESVASAGDVNGDGYDDVIVGAPSYDYLYPASNPGQAFVFLGGPFGVQDGDPSTAATALDGHPAAGPYSFAFGQSVASAGDVNGDGFDDVIVGALINDQTVPGAAYIYLGGAMGITSGGLAAAATQLTGTAPQQFGQSVASAGDVNGDGFDDVIVGCTGFTNPQSREGAAFIFLGSASGIPSGNGPATAATQLESNQIAAGTYFAEFGTSVASAGDVNGDGYADVIVGALGYDSPELDEGAAFVYLGSAAGIPDGNPSTAATTLQANLAGALFGTGVASAGDVNGDGYADVIVGARDYANGQASEGGAFVFLGNASGVASAAPTGAGARLESNQAGARLGRSVASAGDVNGDGFDDVIVGSNQFDNGSTDEGAAFIYLGGAAGVPSGSSATAVSRLESNMIGGNLGSSVASAGDVNGDGFGDVIVGAPGYDLGQTNEGAAFLYLGSTSGVPIGNPGNAASLIQANLANAGLGSSVASAGDVNGDGYGDVIVGAPLYDGPEVDEGAAFVFLGSASGVVASGTPANAAARLEANVFAWLGTSVASAGDVNGDGFGDVIVGAPLYSDPESLEGGAFVFHGSPLGVANGSPATASARLEADRISSAFGQTVASAGDVNGDGFGDVIVGATGYDNPENDEGAVFVFHGSATGIGDDNPAGADTLIESNVGSEGFGGSVAPAGDVDGDGFGDVVVSSRSHTNGQSNEGAAFVFHGSPSGVPSGSLLTAQTTLESNQVDAQLGSSVAGAGDVNADGYADVIVGAKGYTFVQASEGAAIVLHGSSTGIPSGSLSAGATLLVGAVPTSGFGSSVAGAGDVNGDGIADVIVGAPLMDNPQTDEGAAYIYFGNRAGRTVRARQRRGGGASAVVQPWGTSSAVDAFTAELTCTHPKGPGSVKAEFEACPLGAGFASPSCSVATNATWVEVGPGSLQAVLSQAFSGLMPNTLHHWRGRCLLADATGAIRLNPAHGPWRRLQAQLVGADIRTATDSDGDGLVDAVDNCRFVSNAGQEDDGGLGAASPADAIGNVCQCGNVAGGGRVEDDDVLAYRLSLADPAGAALTGAAQTRCVVLGTGSDCDVLQVVVIRRALAVPSLPPVTSSAAAQVCSAAAPP